MMIWTARFSRKKAALAAILAAAAVFAALFFLRGRQSTQAPPDLPRLTTNEERVAYLESFGWEVEPEPLETLQFLLPEQLSEPYLQYNVLQLAQGFDLTQCCGKRVARYTYAVSNYPGRSQGVQANLYVCEDLPAAGDILAPGEDGFQIGLSFPSEETSASGK